MTKKIFFKILSAAFVCILILLLLTSASLGKGCFSIVVGKDASADGYVIMAHNEDDSPPQIVNHHKVPRQRHNPGEKVKLLNGGELEQAKETWSLIWSEMPGMLFSDSYVNQWGVSIASDRCPSKEDRPELTDGGISLLLRRIVAQRAKTAREGVFLAGELVERFGYDSSGRTYAICDPEEGWLFCAINGKHWLAQRVPDDQVAVVANTFTIHQIDLSDTINFLGSDDIVDYAVLRGWYDPQKDRSFDFASVYSDPEASSDSSNFCRQWSGLCQIASISFPLGQKLPFSVRPEKKLDVQEVMEILRDHYEGTQLFQSSPETGSPHENSVNTICNPTTQTSFVVQLRADMPLDIGICYWVCLGPPCTSVFLPFHFGITRFPEGFSFEGETPSFDSYFEEAGSVFEVDMSCAFLTFWRFHNRVEDEYGKVIPKLKVEFDDFEKRALTMQKPVEKSALKLYPEDKATALETLTKYSDGLYLEALETLERVLSEK